MFLSGRLGDGKSAPLVAITGQLRRWHACAQVYTSLESNTRKLYLQVHVCTAKRNSSIRLPHYVSRRRRREDARIALLYLPVLSRSRRQPAAECKERVRGGTRRVSASTRCSRDDFQLNYSCAKREKRCPDSASLLSFQSNRVKPIRRR